MDIERAIAAGYKKPQVFKLYKRHYSSLLHLGRLLEALKGMIIIFSLLSLSLTPSFLSSYPLPLSPLSSYPLPLSSLSFLFLVVEQYKNGIKSNDSGLTKEDRRLFTQIIITVNNNNNILLCVCFI